uniref:SWIM-type domain-containing protein n=1 Tax=Rhizophagus irregularis (strain DAOM 181602 / DAOM 197198 / MUCL 43194) TaxID=747089 RepID=U9TG81_RHIID
MKYERIIKMRNILPRQTLDDVPSKFFVGINEICKEFLIPHILSATQNQMKHSFFYDAYLVDKDTIQQVDNTDDNEGFRKDDYDATQILLQTIIKKIQNLLIVEIWKVQPELSQTKSHFVVLMADGSFSCICNLLISYGIPCRHFYRVLRKSLQAKFHISCADIKIRN